MVVGVHDVSKAFPKDKIPMQRSGSTEEMGGGYSSSRIEAMEWKADCGNLGVVLFMAGKAGAYMTGCVIVTDGGRLSVLPSTY